MKQIGFFVYFTFRPFKNFEGGSLTHCEKKVLRFFLVEKNTKACRKLLLWPRKPEKARRKERIDVRLWWSIRNIEIWWRTVKCPSRLMKEMLWLSWNRFFRLSWGLGEDRRRLHYSPVYSYFYRDKFFCIVFTTFPERAMWDWNQKARTRTHLKWKNPRMAGQADCYTARATASEIPKSIISPPRFRT